jgi:hypothetical protein
LIGKKISKEEQDKVYLKLIPEPVVSVLSFPFAVFGPDIWTLSWLLLIPVGYLSKRWQTKIVKKSQE